MLTQHQIYLGYIRLTVSLSLSVCLSVSLSLSVSVSVSVSVSLSLSLSLSLFRLINIKKSLTACLYWLLGNVLQTFIAKLSTKVCFLGGPRIIIRFAWAMMASYIKACILFTFSCITLKIESCNSVTCDFAEAAHDCAIRAFIETLSW